MFTLKQLHIVLPNAGAHAEAQYPHLLQYMADYGIAQQHRDPAAALYDLCAFIATIGHESMQFTRTRELGGNAYFTEHYEWRADLGNTQPGDGARFCGRGDIQYTGRYNYVALTRRLRLRYGESVVPDFVATPEALEQLPWAVASACDFWYEHGLSAIAIRPDFKAVTKKVNGGLNGWEDRLLLYTRALRVFGTPDFGNVGAGVESTAPPPR